MNLLALRKHPAIIVSILIVFSLLAFIIASIYYITDASTTTISGKVVNMNGHPIPKCRLAIQPIDIIDGEMCQVSSLSHQSQTDSNGFFNFNNISPGRAQFVVKPDMGYRNRDVEIQSINLSGMTFLRLQTSQLQVIDEHLQEVNNGAPQKLSTIGGIPFEIDSGLNLNDIVIEVSPRMCIRGKILQSNGTPLTNAQGKLNLQYKTLDGMISDDLSFYPTYTDSEGYFMKYVNFPMVATVSVEYNGSAATSEAIKISDEQRRHDLIFHLELDRD
ncbi:carboxypeptidase regulatory-like domain-containing protein [Candidatus Poribacteria bacterium]|nr:carboxypeptidase regulatory-like domain-containing protein [Candidatus Poribacteria bacterium]